MANGQVASFSLSLKTAAELGVIPEDNEGLIDHLRAIQGVIVAVFFEELADGKVRVSMRSKDESVDVCAICQKFGGGGHKLAAGARVRGTLAEVEERVLEEIREVVKRTATPDGVLLVDKAEGMTSHDVVALVRRQLANEKGRPLRHARSDRDRFAAAHARARNKNSGSAHERGQGICRHNHARRHDRHPGPRRRSDAGTAGAALDENQIRAAFEKFRGDFYQMPPMVSAKKHGGVPLYKLARQGKIVEREPRLVHVYRYTIDRIALPEIDFSVLCSKGFYVRTYAHDIGEVLGCGAHLKSLAADEVRPVRRRQCDHGR